MKVQHKNILKRFESSIVASVNPGGRLLLGLSGGVDSMVLAELTLKLAHKYAWQIEAVHINHALRGKESERDQAFVQAYSQAHHIVCHTQRAALKGKHNIQERARQLRYSIMRELLKKRLFDKLILAHHLDDQLELFFLRLTQGTGLKGLAGMEECRDGWLVRPLLGFNKVELIDYAKSVKLKYVEDSSNKTAAYTRNRLRQELLPVLHRLAPQAGKHITNLMSQFRSDEVCLQNMAANLLNISTLKYTCDTITLDIAKLAACETALLSRLFQLTLQKIQPGSSLNRAKLLALTKLILTQEGSGELNLRHNLHAYRDYHLLTLTLKPRVKDLAIKYQVAQDQLPIQLDIKEIGREVVIEKQNNFKKSATGILPVQPGLFINAKRLMGPLVIRNWLPGDSLRLPWSGARRKLKDYFIDKKISRPQRTRMLVVACNARPIALLVPDKVTGSFVDHDYIVGADSSDFVRISILGVDGEA